MLFTVQVEWHLEGGEFLVSDILLLVYCFDMNKEWSCIFL